MDRQFGNYILHERVGLGGMGEVFRATKHGPDGFKVQAALKVILPHLAREEPFRKRFSKEALLAASLNHPNIVQVNGFDIIDETPFIEMEYVQGADLRRILRSLLPDEKLTLDESLVILHAVARGLDYAHSHDNPEGARGGIIHCDLNPHNILISTLGEVKVADFGIARAIHGNAAASATVRGKLAYMSPEQMEGRELDRRTDLFSLGTLAYQLLSGVHPFERSSEGGTIAAIGKAEYVPLRDITPDLPPQLHDLVDKLLSLDPASRPESAHMVVETLQPLIPPAAGTTLAGRVQSLASRIPNQAGLRPDGSPTAPTIYRRGLSRFWLYLAVIAAAFALFAGVFFIPMGTTPDQVQVNETDTVKTTPELIPTPEKTTFSEKTVTVESEPPGAEITADGIPLGTAPVVVSSENDGSMPLLKARLYGFYDKSFQIPPETENRFVINLVPLPTGTVRISARPWASVSFQGKVIGETPVSIDKIPVGRHTLILSCEPLGVEREMVIEVKEGINTVSVQMGE